MHLSLPLFTFKTLNKNNNRLGYKTKYLFGTQHLGICNFHTLWWFSLLGYFTSIDPFEFVAGIYIGSLRKTGNCHFPQRQKGLTLQIWIRKVIADKMAVHWGSIIILPFILHPALEVYLNGHKIRNELFSLYKPVGPFRRTKFFAGTTSVWNRVKPQCF